MKKQFLYALCALAIAAFASGCTEEKPEVKPAPVEIVRDYTFSVTHLPVPAKIEQGQTVDIRLKIVREGKNNDARYTMRYFQPDGKGRIANEAGTILAPNDLYPLKSDEFRLYYTSLSATVQTIDLYILDNHGNTKPVSFLFENGTTR